MSIYTKRGYARNYNGAQIIFANSDTEKYTNAIMYNCSVDGMYFISEKALLPGSLIDIEIMDQPVSCKISGENGRGYCAEVKWCKKLSGSQHYGVGVRFFKSTTENIQYDS